jgi:hypothetical protein
MAPYHAACQQAATLAHSSNTLNSPQVTREAGLHAPLVHVVMTGGPAGTSNAYPSSHFTWHSLGSGRNPGTLSSGHNQMPLVMDGSLSVMQKATGISGSVPSARQHSARHTTCQPALDKEMTSITGSEALPWQQLHHSCTFIAHAPHVGCRLLPGQAPLDGAICSATTSPPPFIPLCCTDHPHARTRCPAHSPQATAALGVQVPLAVQVVVTAGAPGTPPTV